MTRADPVDRGNQTEPRVARMLFLVALCLAIGESTAPARAATIKVHFGLTYYSLPEFSVPSVERCSLSVSLGTNLIGVLDAAKRTGCIERYRLSAYDAGIYGTAHHLECINNRCNKAKQPLKGSHRYIAWVGTWNYWEIYENGDVQYDAWNLGLERVYADVGDHFDFGWWVVPSLPLCPCI